MNTQRDSKSLRVGVYVGEGASHSWTWFVDLMERYSYGRLHFIDADAFPRLAPELDVLLVSGGDTFAVARALDAPGAQALQAFLDRGGLYIGSCAGAYLPLNSSKARLSTFNFVKCRINNLTRDHPPVHQMPLKFSTRYGCDYIYHPGYEEITRPAASFGVGVRRPAVCRRLAARAHRYDTCYTRGQGQVQAAVTERRLPCEPSARFCSRV